MRKLNPKELVQIGVMNEELVQIGVMNEELVQNSVMDAKINPKVVHQKSKTRTIMCFCACPSVVLDIREGQPRPPQTDIFWGGRRVRVLPTLAKLSLAKSHLGQSFFLLGLVLFRPIQVRPISFST